MAEHLQKHQWKKGESGNPAGRPKGSKNTATLLQQELTEELLNNQNLNRRVKKVFNKCLDMAEGGDKQMIKFVLGKFIPDSGIAFGDKGDGASQPVVNITIGGTDEPQGITINNEEGEDDG